MTKHEIKLKERSDEIRSIIIKSEASISLSSEQLAAYVLQKEAEAVRAVLGMYPSVPASFIEETIIDNGLIPPSNE